MIRCDTDGCPEPYVGPDTIPYAVILPVCRLGPLTLYCERFNAKPGDPPRRRQLFVCRSSRLRQAISGRLNRRMWGSG